jgi:hypothetical protein
MRGQEGNWRRKSDLKQDDTISLKWVEVTCSFEVAQFYQDETAETINKCADDAMYAAKQAGWNKVEARCCNRQNPNNLKQHRFFMTTTEKGCLYN